MYEVFINNVSLVLSNDESINNAELVHYEVDFGWIDFLFELKPFSRVCVVAKDVEQAWASIKKELLFIQAAGGVIFQDNKVLFIFRKGKWDLPKGKLEVGETIEECAVREVEEECGVTNISIAKQLPSTYHIYSLEDQLVLKETFWYKMNSNDNYNLSPQVEEGIECVEWKDSSEIKDCIKNTYPNIIKVLESL